MVKKNLYFICSALLFASSCSVVDKGALNFSGKGSPTFKRNGKLAEKVIQTDTKAPVLI